MTSSKKPDIHGCLGNEAMALRDLLAELARTLEKAASTEGATALMMTVSLGFLTLAAHRTLSDGLGDAPAALIVGGACIGTGLIALLFVPSRR